MTPKEPPSAATAALRSRLLKWYRTNRRTLPWRKSRDPYRVWISEIMLQQTTVAAVTPYYERFVAAFPNVRTLAAAPIDEVLAAWSGLGYYSRARNLHAAAGTIVRRFGGRFPEDHDEALSLPGIGRYTAAAVLSIAYGQVLPVVDGNVNRVLARRKAIAGSPRSREFEKKVRTAAAALIDPAAPGDFNQALMELGARVCTPRNPDCAACPVRRGCRAAATNRVSEFPEAPQRPEARKETLALVVVESEGQILLRKREGAKLMAGLWELPEYAVTAGGDDDPEAVGRELRTWLRDSVHAGAGDVSAAGEARHAIMNRRIRALVFQASVTGRKPPNPGWQFVSRGDLGTRGTSSLVVKALKAAEEHALQRKGELQCTIDL